VTEQAAAFALRVGRHDENEWIGGRQARQHRDDKTEGGRECGLRFRDNFMQRAAGKAAVRQMRIDRRKTEGQKAVSARIFAVVGRQQTAKLSDQGGAALQSRKGSRFLYLPEFLARHNHVNVLCMSQALSGPHSAKRRHPLSLIFGFGRLNCRP
jgi:hypothetical protein